MTCCHVKWCVCLARRRDPISMCAVHAKKPELRPGELAPNEELIDGSFGPCEDCARRVCDAKTHTWRTESTGRCKECRGSGECGDRCGHDHICDAECEACKGSGKCQTCGGSGYGGARICVLEAA